MEPTDQSPPPAVALDPQTCAEGMVRRLSHPEHPKAPVAWRTLGSEALLYPDKLRLALAPGLLLVEISLATDQTGEVALVLPFAVGRSRDQASLQAVTESVPRGDSRLAARWGETAQELVWDAILVTGREAVAKATPDSSLDLGGLFTDGKSLLLIPAKPIPLSELRKQIAG